jgi:membrane-associated phospholipid phosphatase
VATVYCRYHYVADVIAGFALAFVTVPVGNALYRRFGRPQPGSEAPGRGP